MKLIGTDGTQYYTWTLTDGKFALGRSSECDFVVPDKTVSRRHAEIEVQGDDVTVIDLQSHNGTMVNGQKVTTPIRVKPGDHILFGQAQFKLSAAESEPGSSTSMQKTPFADIVPEQSVFLSMNEALKPLPSKVTDLPQVLPTLFDMAKTLVLPEPQEAMLQRALGLVAKVIPAERLAVLFTSPDQEEVYTAATLLPGGRDPGSFTLSRTIVKDLLTNKNAILIGDPMNDPRFASQQSIVMSAMKSAMAVPMLDEERILGILYVDTTNPLHRYNDDYLRLLATFGNIIAARLQNYLLLKEREEKQVLDAELRRASSIQKNLLINASPTIAGYDVHAFQVPSRQVGGDLYDVTVLPDGRLVFLVADVSGKGMGAALLMSNILAAFRILYAAPGFNIEEVVNQVSRQMLKYTAPEDFATLFIGVVSPENNTLQYLNAGHNPPLLVRNDGSIEFLKPTGMGTMIGVFDFSVWQVEQAQLAPGEFVFVFTDGVTEATRGDQQQYGDQRLECLAVARREETPAAIAKYLMDDVEGFVGDAPRSDDITLLIVKRT